jgi:hypothetical protein
VCCLTAFRLYRWYEGKHVSGLDSVGGGAGEEGTGRRKGRDGGETADGQPKARFSIPEVKGGMTSPGSRRYRVAPDAAPAPRAHPPPSMPVREAPAPLQPTRMASDAAAAASLASSLSPQTLPLPGVKMGDRSSQS